MIAAASLVLVSVLSLAIYFSIGNKIVVPVAVKPSSSATEIVWSTDESGETIATEVVIVPDGTRPTEPKSGIAQTIESIFGTRDNTLPTTAPDTDHGRMTPTTKTSPIDGRSDPMQSTDTSTQGDEPQKPTQPPTEEPEPVEPTEPPDNPPVPTEPPEDPPDPTEPPDDPPNPTESPYKDVISDLVYIGEIPDGSVIYCWLYDDHSHRRMYENDAYTEMFYAEVTPLDDGYAFLDYTPKAHGVDLPYAGHYQYLWYLSEDGGHTGKRLYLGDIYLNN